MIIIILLIQSDNGRAIFTHTFTHATPIDVGLYY